MKSQKFYAKPADANRGDAKYAEIWVGSSSLRFLASLRLNIFSRMFEPHVGCYEK